MLTLPPKRFEDPFDPVFDPIRHKPWFFRYERRAVKIPWLKQAYSAIQRGLTQQAAADEFKVDSRELRDYVAFLAIGNAFDTRLDPRHQQILDRAYKAYSEANGEYNFRHYLDRECPLWGIHPRHVSEKWDVNPNFWPLNYPLRRP